MTVPKTCNLPNHSPVIASVESGNRQLDFATVLAQNQSMVFSVALRFLRNREVAEELAQDVFLQLYQNLHRIETPAHAVWWLRRTVCHRSIDEVRKRKLRPGIGLDSIPDPAAPSRETDLLLDNRIRQLVDSLPEKAKAVIVLRYQEDLDPTEISEMLDMPVSTVKSHLHRSLTLLRGRLKAKTASRQEVPCGL